MIRKLKSWLFAPRCVTMYVFRTVTEKGTYVFGIDYDRYMRQVVIWFGKYGLAIGRKD